MTQEEEDDLIFIDEDEEENNKVNLTKSGELSISKTPSILISRQILQPTVTTAVAVKRNQDFEEDWVIDDEDDIIIEENPPTKSSTSPIITRNNPVNVARGGASGTTPQQTQLRTSNGISPINRSNNNISNGRGVVTGNLNSPTIPGERGVISPNGRGNNGRRPTEPPVLQREFDMNNRGVGGRGRGQAGDIQGRLRSSTDSITFNRPHMAVENVCVDDDLPTTQPLNQPSSTPRGRGNELQSGRGRGERGRGQDINIVRGRGGPLERGSPDRMMNERGRGLDRGRGGQERGSPDRMRGQLMGNDRGRGVSDIRRGSVNPVTRNSSLEEISSIKSIPQTSRSFEDFPTKNDDKKQTSKINSIHTPSPSPSPSPPNTINNSKINNISSSGLNRVSKIKSDISNQSTISNKNEIKKSNSDCTGNKNLKESFTSLELDLDCDDDLDITLDLKIEEDEVVRMMRRLSTAFSSSPIMPSSINGDNSTADVLDQLTLIRVLNGSDEVLSPTLVNEIINNEDDSDPHSVSFSDPPNSNANNFKKKIVENTQADKEKRESKSQKKASFRRRWFSKYQESKSEQKLTTNEPKIDIDSYSDIPLTLIKPQTKSMPIVAQDHRANIVAEIIFTEEEYVNDLDLIDEFYYVPIEKSYKSANRLMIQPDAQIVFSNISAIRNLSHTMLDLLLPQKGLPSDQQSISSWFNFLSQCLLLYAEYCSNHQQSLAILTRLREKDKNFLSFLEYTKLQPRCRNLDLESFLIKPVQRVCKYPLLLRELIKCTAEEHPDYQGLQKALGAMQNICEKINEKQRVIENMNHFLTIKSRTGVCFIQSDRRFILDGIIFRYKRKKMRKGRYVLFSDLFVFICGGRVTDQLPLKESHLLSVSVPNCDYAFEIISKKAKITLCPSTLQEKEDLLSSLNDLISVFFKSNLNSMNKHMQKKSLTNLFVEEERTYNFKFLYNGVEKSTILEDPLNYSILINRAARLFEIITPEMVTLYSKSEHGETLIKSEDFNRVLPFLSVITVRLEPQNGDNN